MDLRNYLSIETLMTDAIRRYGLQENDYSVSYEMLQLHKDYFALLAIARQRRTNMTPEDVLVFIDRYYRHLPAIRKDIEDRIRAYGLQERLEEREACARLADIEHEDPDDDIDAVLTRLATAIRARNQ